MPVGRERGLDIAVFFPSALSCGAWDAQPPVGTTKDAIIGTLQELFNVLPRDLFAAVKGRFKVFTQANPQRIGLCDRQQFSHGVPTTFHDLLQTSVGAKLKLSRRLARCAARGG